MRARAPLVLASASPRRTQLLAACGIPHEVVPAEDAEPPPGHMAPAEHVRVSALAKAAEVARRLPGRLVLGADTIVTLSDAPEDVLGKPRDEDDARRMLRLLSGRAHRVLTGMALVGGRLSESVLHAETEVRFAVLPEELILRYVATGEPADKAGAYAVQGRAGMFISEIHGSYSGIMGLPLYETALLLAKFGYRF